MRFSSLPSSLLWLPCVRYLAFFPRQISCVFCAFMRFLALSRLQPLWQQIAASVVAFPGKAGCKAKLVGGKRTLGSSPPQRLCGFPAPRMGRLPLCNISSPQRGEAEHTEQLLATWSLWHRCGGDGGTLRSLSSPARQGERRLQRGKILRVLSPACSGGGKPFLPTPPAHLAKRLGIPAGKGPCRGLKGYHCSHSCEGGGYLCSWMCGSLGKGGWSPK